MNVLRTKELEMKQKELTMQVRLKAKTTPTLEPVGSGSEPTGFGISKHVRIVISFQEQEIDKYLLLYGNKFRI